MELHKSPPPGQTFHSFFKPQKLSINVSELHKFRQWSDLAALK